jgi:septum formation protein
MTERRQAETAANGAEADSTASARAEEGREGPVLILASASPRRLALLEQVGLRPDLLCPVDIDETPRRRETPRDYVRRMALEKLEAAKVMPQVKEIFAPRWLLTADTVVAVGRRILPKAEDIEEARAHLKLLSGRSHRVLTAICLLTPEGKLRKRLVDTKVRFKRLSAAEIDAYLLSDEWRGKAGAYAIQGLAAAFVRHINGSWTSVVGLPTYEVVQLLAGTGFPVLKRWPRKEPPPPLL